MKFLRILLLLLVFQVNAQQGGMWVPSLLKGMNENEMKQLGMKISAADIYDANKPGIKDAVPQFNGGCTAEMISPKGLLLTNHHCGFSQVQSHSSVEHDYLTDGFWAMNMEQELPNPGVTVMFVVRIDDVTEKVLAGVDALPTEAEKQKKIAENIASVQVTSPKEAWQE
ncbi:MAG TPA: S46 family peptidase, partial [Flavobacterium sp.]